MKINSILSYTPIKTVTQNHGKQTSNISSPVVFSIYKDKNLSFRGEPIYNSILIENDIKLIPFKEYYADDTAVLVSAGYKIDLASDELRDKVKNLKKNEKFIIGRDETKLKDMPNSISRRHLQIKRNANGLLSVCDLNSTNGTVLKSNFTQVDTRIANQRLESGRYYLLPYNAVVTLSNEKINLNDYKQTINTLYNGIPLIMGRGNNADIKIQNPFVSASHLSVQPYQDKLLVKDLYSTNGSTFQHCETINNDFFKVNDYSGINEVTALKKGIRTIIPDDCQIYLGEDLTLDVRNKNILELLNQKGLIQIGRSPMCDLVVDEFYSQVSRIHMQLEKVGNKIIATDLNASNNTQIIPKNKIKAFNGGVENLRLGQSNIADCYLLSVLYALSRTPKGQKYIENMVKVDDRGNYNVKFYDSQKPISVAPEDLDGQIVDGNRKRSVKGDLGIRAIERAYGRMLINCDYGNKTLFLEIDKGGSPIVALRKLTGIQGDFISTSMGKIEKTLYDICQKGLDNFVLTCSTPKKSKYNNYVDSQRRFISRHVYGIKDINPYTRNIEIINPHNTRTSYTISWDEFEQMFDFLYVGEFNNKLLF